MWSEGMLVFIVYALNKGRPWSPNINSQMDFGQENLSLETLIWTSNGNWL